MNEIDKTVERIGQLPEIITVIKFNEGFADIRSDDLKNLANAYTQLKADLATAKQGLEHYADRGNWNPMPLAISTDRAFYVADSPNGYDLAQQTLDLIGKE